MPPLAEYAAGPTKLLQPKEDSLRILLSPDPWNFYENHSLGNHIIANDHTIKDETNISQLLEKTNNHPQTEQEAK